MPYSFSDRLKRNKDRFTELNSVLAIYTRTDGKTTTLDVSPILKRPMLMSPSLPVVGVDKQWFAINITVLVIPIFGEFRPEPGDTIAPQAGNMTGMVFQVVPEDANNPHSSWTTSERERVIVHTQCISRPETPL